MSRQWDLRHGDCRDVMADLDAESVDAIVTDPPYGLAFMGKDWDKPQQMLGKFDGQRGAGVTNSRGYIDNDPRAFQAWVESWAREALRVLKPGGHLLAFGGTRTYHRLASGIENGGFEVRDCLAWLYGTGFPKSLNVSKAIDKAAGVEPEAVETNEDGSLGGFGRAGWNATPRRLVYGEPVTTGASRWQGWGTALKPAHEPIVLARKPFTGTVADNVLQHGTAALNIDACRVGDEERFNPPTHKDQTVAMGSFAMCDGEGTHVRGRWPANVILDEEAGRLLDSQTGRNVSRFFYSPKASRAERGAANNHPTVKPLALMAYLVRLVTPPDGLILDPFAGSGSTGVAALREGFRFLGIELSGDYLAVASDRLAAEGDEQEEAA